MAVQPTRVSSRRSSTPVAVPQGMRVHELGLLAGAVLIVCILSMLYLAQTARVAAASHRLQQLQDEHVQLIHDAEQWEYRIAKASRLDVVAERAARLGLRPATGDQLRFATIELPAVPVVASSPEHEQ